VACLVLFAGTIISAEIAAPGDVDARAFAMDDTCAAGSTGCTLSALQLKGRKLPNLEADVPGQGKSMPLRRQSRSRQRRETAGHINDGRLEGAAYADYAVNVSIGSQVFQVIVDTGSSTFAVAAAPGDGCREYYNGPCTNQNVTQFYGSGSWLGNVCMGMEVTLAGLWAGSPLFVGITEQGNFFTQCSNETSGIVNDGIVGMAYPSLIEGFDGIPLFDSVVKMTGVPNIFSIQCCGWKGGEAASGQLVLGGVDTRLYTGEFQYTPITKHEWFCVEMVDVYVEGHSTLPPIPARPCLDTFPPVSCFFFPCGFDAAFCSDGICTCNAGTCYNATEGSCSPLLPASLQQSSAANGKVLQRASQADCPAIIDSGTSEIILTPEHYYRVMHILQPMANRLMRSAHCIVESMLGSFPNVIIKLGGNVTLSVPPTTYFQPRPDGSGCYLLFIGQAFQNQSIIGQPLMEAYYTVFDKEHDRIGFAPIAGCA